mmetsp:Transcript_6953/g.11697  ORF Transcript_6953/g.11697 Transcript_6953/m.11697 type:complete len:102 (+) Transcript_6953:132-437(+)
MILNVKDKLMESDFSMCLAYLLSYEQPEDPSVLVTRAIEVKKKLLQNSFVLVECDDEEEKRGAEDDLDDFFDFESIENEKTSKGQTANGPKQSQQKSTGKE